MENSSYKYMLLYSERKVGFSSPSPNDEKKIGLQSRIKDDIEKIFVGI